MLWICLLLNVLFLCSVMFRFYSVVFCICVSVLFGCMMVFVFIVRNSFFIVILLLV